MDAKQVFWLPSYLHFMMRNYQKILFNFMFYANISLDFLLKLQDHPYAIRKCFCRCRSSIWNDIYELICNNNTHAQFIYKVIHMQNRCLNVWRLIVVFENHFLVIICRVAKENPMKISMNIEHLTIMLLNKCEQSNYRV